jgi:hypothetical protein
MANITITLTEEELHAFEVAKHMMDSGYNDNLAIDEEMGVDHYGRAHRGLDSLEAKIEAKVQFETDIAYLKEQYPNHTLAVLRKALREYNKDNA